MGVGSAKTGGMDDFGEAQLRLLQRKRFEDLECLYDGLHIGEK